MHREWQQLSGAPSVSTAGQAGTISGPESVALPVHNLSAKPTLSVWLTNLYSCRERRGDRWKGGCGWAKGSDLQAEGNSMLSWRRQKNPGSLNPTHKHSTTISVLLLSALSSPFLSPPPSSANPKVINRPRLLSQPDRGECVRVSAAGLIGWPFKTGLTWLNKQSQSGAIRWPVTTGSPGGQRAGWPLLH